MCRFFCVIAWPGGSVSAASTSSCTGADHGYRRDPCSIGVAGKSRHLRAVRAPLHRRPSAGAQRVRWTTNRVNVNKASRAGDGGSSPSAAAAVSA